MQIIFSMRNCFSISISVSVYLFTYSKLFHIMVYIYNRWFSYKAQ